MTKMSFFCGLLVVLVSLQLFAQQQESQPIEKDISAIYEADGIQVAIERLHQFRITENEEFAASADKFLAFARELIARNNSADASMLLNELAQMFPDNAMIKMTLASALRANGQTIESYPVFSEGLELMGRERLKQIINKPGQNILLTAEDVIERHLQAIGGREALAEIKTMVVELKIHDANGINDEITRYYKRPLKFREVIKNNPVETVVNGDKVWRIRNNEWQHVASRTYLRQSSIDDFFLDYQAKGVTYRYYGLKVLGFSPVYHLKRTFSDGYEEDMFFSFDSGFLTVKRTPYNSGPSFYSLWDYRDVGGINIPFVSIREVQGEPPHGGVFINVSLNIPLDDALFEAPVK